MKTKLFSQQLLIKQIMVSVVQGSVVIKKPVTQSRTLEWSRSTDIKFQPAGPKLPTVHISQHSQLYHEKQIQYFLRFAPLRPWHTTHKLQRFC